MSTKREIEYIEVHNWMRYQLDYRAKIFNFCVIFNAALIALTIEHISTQIGKVMIGIVAVIVTFLFLMSELRTMKTFTIYRIYGETLESELGFSALSNISSKIGLSKIKLRFLFPTIYILFLILWLAIIIFGNKLFVN